MSMERYESARTQTPRNVIFQLGPSAGPGRTGDKTEASEVTHHVEGVMPCFSPRKGFVLLPFNSCGMPLLAAGSGGPLSGKSGRPAAGVRVEAWEGSCVLRSLRGCCPCCEARESVS